jgi:hypothetical protein
MNKTDPNMILIDKLLRDVSELKSTNKTLAIQTTQMTILFESLLAYMIKHMDFKMEEFNLVINEITSAGLEEEAEVDSFMVDSEMNEITQMKLKTSTTFDRPPLFKSTIGEA